MARENAALHPTSNQNQTDDNEGFRTEAGMVRRRTQREPEVKTEANPESEDAASPEATRKIEQKEIEQKEIEQATTTENTAE